MLPLGKCICCVVPLGFLQRCVTGEATLRHAAELELQLVKVDDTTNAGHVVYGDETGVN